jgi:SAM-dependent methyltransferase
MFVELAQGRLAHGGKVLDFGCGAGTFLALARQAGIDAHGCDSYEGCWGDTGNVPDPAIKPLIRQIVGGRIDFPDESFDVIVSNQVFEHIDATAIGPALGEIGRLLKPGGWLIAMFPMTDTWFEGHLGIYFPHWMSKAPGLQLAYLGLCFRLGQGYSRAGHDANEWAHVMRQWLQQEVHHHSWRDVRGLCRRILGSEPVDVSERFIAHRLSGARAGTGSSLVGAVGAVPALARMVCHVRAGRLFEVRKNV